MREAPHRGARVIGTDALRILVISQESSDGEEGHQDNEDNPNIDAHQSRLLPPVRESIKKAPDVPELRVSKQRKRLEGNLGAPMLCQSTNQARRGARKRPTRQGGQSTDGPGLVTTRCSVGSGPKRVMTIEEGEPREKAFHRDNIRGRGDGLETAGGCLTSKPSSVQAGKSFPSAG